MKSLLLKGLVAELKSFGINLGREVSGIAHIEHLIADHGKEIVKKAFGNAITNMITHVDITGFRQPTAEALRQWHADRKWVKDNCGF